MTHNDSLSMSPFALPASCHLLYKKNISHRLYGGQTETSYSQSAEAHTGARNFQVAAMCL